MSKKMETIKTVLFCIIVITTIVMFAIILHQCWLESVQHVEEVAATIGR